MKTKLLICVPCHERRAIMEACVPTLIAGMHPQDVLALYNDGSKEYGTEELYALIHGCGSEGIVVSSPTRPIGIEAQRRVHFTIFGDTYQTAGYTHLYLTDHDALHDPDWRKHALMLQDFCTGAPICLYNTAAHRDLADNTILDQPSMPVVWRKFAPGISYLLSRDHVLRVLTELPKLPDCWNWDWTVPRILKHKFATSRVSYVDHIGFGGMHHKQEEGIAGGDRALNPTEFLVRKRSEVIAKLQ